MGNEYYDKDGYVYTKSSGGYEPKWDVWTQSQVREGHDRETQPSGYSSEGTPLYKGRDSGSSSNSSSDDGFENALAVIAFIMLIIILISIILVIYAIVAPAISVIRKEAQTQYGKRQLRNFGITVAMTSFIIVLTIFTLGSLAGHYSNEWARLFQFVIAVLAWAFIIHLAVKRGFWRPAMEATRFFGRGYFNEFILLIEKGGKSLEGLLS